MSTKTCPSCGSPLSSDSAKFCAVCGAPLAQQPAVPIEPATPAPPPAVPIEPAASAPPPAQATPCPRCQSPRAPGKKFCSSCGYSFDAPPVSAAAPVAQQLPSLAATAPPRRRGKGLLVLLVLLLVAGLGTGGFLAWKHIQDNLEAASVNFSDPEPTTQALSSADVADSESSSTSVESTPPASPAPTPASSTAPAADGWGIQDSNVGRISPSISQEINPLHETFEPVDVSGATHTYSLRIEPQWDAVSGFDEHGLARVKLGNHWGLIDKSGRYVANPRYFSINFFFDGLAVVDRDNKFGFVDTSGREAIAPQWDNAMSFSDGLAAVSIDGKLGYIDTSGALVIEPEYQIAGFFREGFAAVKRDGKVFYIDHQGTQVSPYYELASDFSEGLAPVCIDGKWGYVDQNFSLVIPPSYEMAKPFSSGLAIVQQDGDQFFINREQSRSVAVDQLWNFLDNAATAKVGDVYGYIDFQTGEFMLLPQYKDVFAFAYGVAPVVISGEQWNFIRSDGSLAFPNSYDSASRYFNSLSKVTLNGKAGFVNLTGEEFIPLIWEDAGLYGSDMISVKQDGKWGFLAVERR